MNIYVPIEIKVRELEAKILLALAAAERGHSVVLGGKEDTLGLARRGTLKPGIVHDKSLTPSEAKMRLLNDLHAEGHVVTSQDEENGLLDLSYEAFARFRYSKTTCALASRILTWGSYDARGVRTLCGADAPDNIAATGSPRVDLWRREFADYYKRTGPLTTVGGSGDYVLVSSNMGVVLDFRPFWEELGYLREKFPRDLSGIVDDEVEFEFYKEVGWLTSLLSEFVRMIRALAVAQPELRIVVRPHPVEIEEGWRRLIGDYPNVIVTREGPINGWIRGARALIHNGCTSGFEAVIGGVPAIAYSPLPSPYEKVVPNAISHRVESLDALLDAVRTVSSGGQLDVTSEWQARQTTFLRDRFANLDGPLAADRIVDEWEQLSDVSLEQPNDWAGLRRALGRRGVKNAIGRLLPALKSRSANRYPSLTRHKYPDLTDAEVDATVHNLRSHLGRFDGVVHERLGGRSFVIRPK